jgi:hypothetical protein
LSLLFAVVVVAVVVAAAAAAAAFAVVPGVAFVSVVATLSA